MRELPYLVTCSCGWTVPAADFRIAQAWRKHHIAALALPPHHPLSDGKTHTATITKKEM
jgi:hypothetical protein